MNLSNKLPGYCSLSAGEILYIVPRGCKSVEEVIEIKSRNAAQIEISLPNETYQIITDQDLMDKEMTLQRYLEMTPGGRE